MSALRENEAYEEELLDYEEEDEQDPNSINDRDTGYSVKKCFSFLSLTFLIQYSRFGSTHGDFWSSFVLMYPLFLRW